MEVGFGTSAEATKTADFSMGFELDSGAKHSLWYGVDFHAGSAAACAAHCVAYAGDRDTSNICAFSYSACADTDIYIVCSSFASAATYSLSIWMAFVKTATARYNVIVNGRVAQLVRAHGSHP